MATVGDLREKLKGQSDDLKIVILMDEQYYDINLNIFKSVYVKKEKNWIGQECYGIADENDPDSFEVYTIGGTMLDDKQGTKAIIELQALAGIKESEERAKEAWNSFSESEKLQTEYAHKAMCGGFK
jgi:hypothetical protein